MNKTEVGTADQDLMRAMHKAIQEVTSGIESFGFNAAIAKLYGFSAILTKSTAGFTAQREAIMTLAQLMSPMTPHLSEHIWLHQGGDGLITNAPWPTVDTDALTEDSKLIIVQVNGKLRSKLTVAADASKDAVETLALADENVHKFTDGKTVRKIIYVPGKLLNIVAN